MEQVLEMRCIKCGRCWQMRQTAGPPVTGMLVEAHGWCPGCEAVAVNVSVRAGRIEGRPAAR